MIIKGGQRSHRLPFSSSSYPSGRRFCCRCRAPPSPHPSSSSSDRIFFFPPPLKFYVTSRTPPRRFRFRLPFCRFCRFCSQGQWRRRLHACVRINWRIWWIRCDGSRTFRTRAGEVSSTAVRGGFDLFLMTPRMACQNPSCYKNRAALAQAANQTRENFAAITTRTSYAPVWLQAHKM